VYVSISKNAAKITILCTDNVVFKVQSCLSLVFCFLLVAVEDASSGKETSQSATVADRYGNYAVDGNTNTTDLSMCASAFYDNTIPNHRAWWQVDLGDFYLVNAIAVYFPTVRPG